MAAVTEEEIPARRALEHQLRALGYGPLAGVGGEGFLREVGARLAQPLDLPPQSAGDIYPLRALCPPALLAVSGPFDIATIAALVPELVAAQLNLLAERTERGKPTKAAVFDRLGLHLDLLERRWRYVNRDTRRLRKWLAEHDIPQERGPRPRRGPRLNPFAPPPTLVDELAGLGSGLGYRRRLLRIFERHLDRRSGLFTLDDARKRPQRFLVHPVCLEALLALAVRLDLALAPPPDDYPARRPPSGAGLLAWLDSLAAVPDLPRPIGHCPPTSLRAELAEEAARRIEAVALERLGYSLRVAPLPGAAPFVLSLRRDVDRPLAAAQLAECLRWERASGVTSTWYFKADTYDEAAARALTDAGDGVGWHVCHAGLGDDGFAQRLRASFSGTTLGSTFHGGQDSSYWRGRSSLDAVARQRYDYSERLADWLPHPELDPATGMALIQAGLKVESQPDSVPAHEALIRRYRGHMVIESHPDLFSPELAASIAAWKAEGAVVRPVSGQVRAVRDAYRATCRLSVDGGRRVLEWLEFFPDSVEIALPAGGHPGAIAIGGSRAAAVVDGAIARYAAAVTAAEPRAEF